MNENKKNYSRFLPIFFSLAVIFGVFIGIIINRPSNKGNKQISNKLSYITDIIMQNYVDSVDYETLQNSMITGMLEKLDPHSVYITADEFNEANDPLKGNFEGIGVQFRILNDTILVINTITSGPSEKAGVMAGDRIVKIEDKNVAGIGIKDTDVVKKLKGKKGTKVKISVLRKGINHLIDFTITRDVIPTYSIDVSYMTDKEIGYIKLSKFSATTGQEFTEALKKLLSEGMKKLILDLRGNGGGILQSAIEVADEFLPEKKIIVYTEGNNRPNEYAKATSKGLFEDKPLVILIDELSASASEIIAGAIQDNDRGTIIGRRSFGKGLVQEQFKLSDGSALRLTIARYHTPTGRCIQKPYSSDIELYMNDLNQRFINGEFEAPDTVHFADSLKYKTPKGKIVYGGGGIMPDIYIPLINGRNNDIYNQVINKVNIYQFAFEYTDNNRKKLSVFKNSDDFIKNFAVDDKLFSNFIEYANSKGFALKKNIDKQSETKIKTLIKSLIARNLFDDKAYYPIYLPLDSAFNKAVQVLKKA